MMNCQTKLRINHLTGVKSVAILNSNANLKFYTSKKKQPFYIFKIFFIFAALAAKKKSYCFLKTKKEGYSRVTSGGRVERQFSLSRSPLLSLSISPLSLRSGALKLS